MARDRAWRRDNRASRLETERRWRAKSKDHRDAYAKDYRQRNSVQVRTWDASWRRSNPEKVREIYRKYRQANPDKGRAWGHTRRARLRGAQGTFDEAQLRARFAYFGDRCVFCGTTEDLTIDHTIPLARGGSNWPSNLRPACLSCNSSKQDRDAPRRTA